MQSRTYCEREFNEDKVHMSQQRTDTSTAACELEELCDNACPISNLNSESRV